MNNHKNKPKLSSSEVNELWEKLRTHSTSLKKIKNPVAWQRKIRQDRRLPRG